MDGDGAEAPSGATEVLRKGIDGDGVAWRVFHQGFEAVHERAVHVVGDDDEVFALILNDLRDAFERRTRNRVRRRVAGIDHEERFYRWIEQLVDLAIGILPRVRARVVDAARV